MAEPEPEPEPKAEGQSSTRVVHTVTPLGFVANPSPAVSEVSSTSEPGSAIAAGAAGSFVSKFDAHSCHRLLLQLRAECGGAMVQGTLRRMIDAIGPANVHADANRRWLSRSGAVALLKEIVQLDSMEQRGDAEREGALELLLALAQDEHAVEQMAFLGVIEAVLEVLTAATSRRKNFARPVAALGSTALQVRSAQLLLLQLSRSAVGLEGALRGGAAQCLSELLADCTLPSDARHRTAMFVPLFFARRVKWASGDDYTRLLEQAHRVCRVRIESLVADLDADESATVVAALAGLSSYVRFYPGFAVDATNAGAITSLTRTIGGTAAAAPEASLLAARTLDMFCASNDYCATAVSQGLHDILERIVCFPPAGLMLECRLTMLCTLDRLAQATCSGRVGTAAVTAAADSSHQGRWGKVVDMAIGALSSGGAAEARLDEAHLCLLATIFSHTGCRALSHSSLKEREVAADKLHRFETASLQGALCVALTSGHEDHVGSSPTLDSAQRAEQDSARADQCAYSDNSLSSAGGDLGENSTGEPDLAALRRGTMMWIIQTLDSELSELIVHGAPENKLDSGPGSNGETSAGADAASGTPTAPELPSTSSTNEMLEAHAAQSAHNIWKLVTSLAQLANPDAQKEMLVELKILPVLARVMGMPTACIGTATQQQCAKVLLHLSLHWPTRKALREQLDVAVLTPAKDECSRDTVGHLDDGANSGVRENEGKSEQDAVDAPAVQETYSSLRVSLGALSSMPAPLDAQPSNALGDVAALVLMALEHLDSVDDPLTSEEIASDLLLSTDSASLSAGGPVDELADDGTARAQTATKAIAEGQPPLTPPSHTRDGPPPLSPASNTSAHSEWSPQQLRPLARGHILLSHAPQQEAEATQLARLLASQGMTPFLSEDVLRGRIALSSSRHRSRLHRQHQQNTSRGQLGQQTASTGSPYECSHAALSLLEVVEKAAVVIVCLSPDYAVSVESRLLVELARKHGRRILPIIVQHPATEEAQRRQQQPETGTHAIRSRSAAALKLERRFAPTGWLLPLFGGVRLLDLTDSTTAVGIPAASSNPVRIGGAAAGLVMGQYRTHATVQHATPIRAPLPSPPRLTHAFSPASSDSSCSCITSSGNSSTVGVGSAFGLLVRQIDEEYEDLRQRLVVSLDRENCCLRAELARMHAAMDRGS